MPSTSLISDIDSQHARRHVVTSTLTANRALLVALGGGLLMLTMVEVTNGNVLSQMGSWNVGHQVISASEEDGASRPMDIDLWFPTSADPASTELSSYGANPARHAVATNEFAEADPFWTIVYSHGTGGDSWENTVFAESLASHGFVVATTTHLDDSPVQTSDTYDRPRDVISIIDVLFDRADMEGDPLQGKINTTGVGVAGFSFGGFTSMAVAAGTTDDVIAGDERVKAIMPIARGSFVAEPVDVGDITVPTLLFAGEDDDFGLDNRLRTGDFERVSSATKFAAIAPGANHVDVGWTRCQQSPAEATCNNDAELEIETVLATAFFDQYLRGNDTYADVLTQSYAQSHEPVFEFWDTAIADTNRNKKTDFEDFLKLAESFGKTGAQARRSRADFNDDSSVDFADFLLLTRNFPTSTENQSAVVPEPNVEISRLLLFCLLAVVAPWRRGRRQ